MEGLTSHRLQDDEHETLLTPPISLAQVLSCLDREVVILRPRQGSEEPKERLRQASWGFTCPFLSTSLV
jgi:hypothetical protein